MEDKITLDRETFKALAIDTRVNILKMLEERFQLTLSDLAEEMSLAPSTVKEHLDKLVSSGLISQVDKGTKWKYYRLTPKGKQILNPYEKRVWIVLSASVLALFGAVYSLMSKLEALLRSTPLMPAPETAPLRGAANGDAMLLAEKAADEAPQVASSAVQVLQIPYLELLAVVLFALFIGICVGYLIRRKRIL